MTVERKEPLVKSGQFTLTTPSEPKLNDKTIARHYRAHHPEAYLNIGYMFKKKGTQIEI